MILRNSSELYKFSKLLGQFNYQMGQNSGCCSKEFQKNLGRKSIPANLLNNIPQPILKLSYSSLPNPSSPQIYGEFHCKTNPVRHVFIKVPQNPSQRTKFSWKPVDIWQYPTQKIRSLTPDQVKQRTFQQKMTWFNHKLDDEKRKFEGAGYNKMRVDPTNVLLSSYQNFKQINFNLETKIVFTDDKGAIDAGGLFRQWVNLSIIQAFSQDLGMFRLCQSDQTAYKIVANKTNKQVFVEIARILGFVIGKSLIQKIPLNCYFNRTIYRMLSNQPIHFSDMYNYDTAIYTSLKYILDHPISEQDLISFTATLKDPFTDKEKEFELQPNGKNIYVNDQNKEQFVRLMIKFYCYDTIKPIIEGLKSSLYQVIPYIFLEIFQPHQFEMILCGRQEIDVDDWKKNTSYKGYMPNQDIIIWFWEVVENFDQKMKANLLHFCTGSTKVPIQGFRFLQCKRGKIKHFNIKYVELNKDNPYPKGITCFNKLQLPRYSNKEDLYSMMIAVCQQQIHDFGLDNIQH